MTSERIQTRLKDKTSHSIPTNKMNNTDKSNIENRYTIDTMCLNNNNLNKWHFKKDQLLQHYEKYGANSTVFYSTDYQHMGVMKKKFAHSTWDTYLNLLETDNHVYEIIDQGERYSFFDFDYDDIQHFYSHIKTTDFQGCTDFCIKNVIEALEAFYLDLNICFDKDRVVILTASYGEKVSLHITNKNTVFKNNEDCALFHNEFKQFITDQSVKNQKFLILNVDKAFDLSVYSKFRNFRAVNQSKMLTPEKITQGKQPIPLKLVSNHSIRDTVITLIDEGQEPMQIPESWYPVESEIEEFIFDADVENADVFNIFNHLTAGTMEDYSSWCSVVWCGDNVGLSQEQILSICSRASNYDEQETLDLIRNHRPNKTKMLRINTIFYYLKSTIDSDTYKKLTEPYRNNLYVQQQIELLTCTEKFKPILKDDKYVYSQVFTENTKRCTVIHAGLGKGKTQGTLDHINSHHYDSIVFLSPRVSFAKSVHARLIEETEYQFELYSKSKKSYIISSSYIVMQTESLHRLDLNAYTNWGNNTLLIVDECESIASQMTVGKTHAMNHMQNLKAFENLFQQSAKIICLDAFVSPKTVNLLQDLHVDFNLYKYTVPLVKRVCRPINDIEFFIQQLALDIVAGKRIYLQCTSNKRLIELIIPVLKAICKRHGKHDVEICEHHSKKNTVKLVDIKEEWPKYNIVCCTSTITVGVNFDTIDCFDALYCFASSASRNLTRDVFQGLYRVRHVKDNMLTYCIDPRLIGLNLLTSKARIKQDLMISSQLLNQQATHHLNTKYEDTPKWVSNLIINNRYEQNMSCMNIVPMFNHYLNECCYTQELELLEKEADSISGVKHVDSIDYDDIPVIDYQEVKALKTRKISGENLSDHEQASVTKFWFLYTVIENCNNQKMCWEYYNKYGFTKFSNIGYEKGVFNGSIRIRDLLEDNKFTGVVSKITLQLEAMGEICEQLDLNNSYELRATITKEKLDKVAPWFIQSSERLHNIFEIRNQVKKGKKEPTLVRKATDLINKVFEKWGYSRLVKSKKKVFSKRDSNGKRSDITPYMIASQNEITENDGLFTFTDDRYPSDVIKHKSKQRFDRLLTTTKKAKPDLELREK